MKNTHLGLLFVSMSSALALVHGCAGELDNPSSFVDASFFPGTGGGGAGGSAGSGAGGSSAGSGGSAGSGAMNCPDMAMFLQTTCGVSTCHGPPVQVGLDLSKVGTGQQYIGMQPTGQCAGHSFIDPNNAQNSLLYLILQNMPPRPCGLLMPYGMVTPIAQTDRDCVLAWVQGVLASNGGGGGGPDAGAAAGPDASSGAGGSTGTGGSMGTGGRSTGAGGTNGAAGR